MCKAKDLIQSLRLPVKYGLFSERGNFFNLPSEYPVALMDKSGYVVFPDRDSLARSGISVAKRINVRGGVKNLPGYVVFTVPLLPEELPAQPYFEGACSTITVNRYERDPLAREVCLAHHGYRCDDCRTLLSECYGPIAEGVIHVHHLTPIATIGSSYQLDPVQELRPVCPNCHAVLHLRYPPFSIEELQLTLS